MNGLAKIILAFALVAITGAVIALISDQLSPSAEAERIKEILEKAQ